MSLEDLEARRQKSFGAFSVLADGIISEYILSKLSAEELALSSRISKFFYVFAHDDQLWKKHCLDKWGRDGEVMENFVYRGSWLLSYLFPTLMSEKEERVIWNHPACQTLRFSDISSHYLYAKWCRCNMDLSNFVPSPDLPPETTIRVEDGRKLTKERFEAFFDAQAIPVLIKDGGVDEWRAWKDWKWENLFQKLLFRVANDHGGINRYFLMTLKSYAHYMKIQRDETPLYIFDNEFADRNLEMADAYEVPKYFQRDLFETLFEGRPPYRWMIIGPARSGLAISRTGMNGHQSLFNEEILDDTKDSATSLLWYLEVYPQLEPGALPLEIVQEPG
ncbi:15775_t:CDS:2 [Acaulospora colombiana]|uniref:15775_t:CDS:1 n=1 Tax=Acaulospora colombiana TaxID=27376 RepID=A0ACA9M406_9GLOM|nr:15775_t:CDS:2 [Acaulospora colombiana]